MIIDSHAHYTHKRYEGDFTYLDWQQGDFCIREGNRRGMLKEMARRGILFSIEVGTELEKTEAQLAVAADFCPYLCPALGVHPKHCAHLTVDHLHLLRALAQHPEVIAIGETGLDYSMPPEQLDKPTQQQWFIRQIELAHELQLPLILHIRDAYEDALDILQQRKEMLHGGVAHCFGSDATTAMALVELGFALGIGARVLQEEQLQNVVRRVPLTALLVETDAPYIRPDISRLPGSGKQRKKVRNSSLILPAVIEKIAHLRGEEPIVMEETIYQNTLRVFRCSPVVRPEGTMQIRRGVRSDSLSNSR